MCRLRILTPGTSNSALLSFVSPDLTFRGGEDMPEHNIETVALGRTGLMVSRLCFGTSGLGDMPDTYGYAVDEGRAKETIRAIFAGPVNFIDTSRNYGLGRSEERIGSIIRERGGLPAGVVLSPRPDRAPGTGRP